MRSCSGGPLWSGRLRCGTAWGACSGCACTGPAPYAVLSLARLRSLPPPLPTPATSVAAPAQGRRAAWKTMSDPGRQQFMWPQPGEPRGGDDSIFKPGGVAWLQHSCMDVCPSAHSSLSHSATDPPPRVSAPPSELQSRRAPTPLCSTPSAWCAWPWRRWTTSNWQRTCATDTCAAAAAAASGPHRT